MEKTIKYLENGEYHYATVKDVGDLAKLKTDSKDDLVAAINDLFENGGKNAGKPEGYDKLVDQMADTIKKQQDISGKLNSAENDLKQKIADSNSSNRTITDELNAQIEVERQKVEALRLAAEQARKELNEQVAKLNTDSQELSKKTTDLANDVENKFGSVQNDYKTVSENLTNEAAALHKQLDDVKNEAEATKSRIQDQAEDIGNIHKTVDNVSNQVTQKIWMTDLDPVKQQVTQNSTEVQETQNQLKTKAEQSSLDLVANSVEKLDTEVKKNSEGLEVTVKKEEFAENVAKLLKDKTNLLLGTRNFAGDKWSNLDHWHEEPGYWNGLKVYSSTSDWYGIQYQYEVKKGNQYTFSFYARQQSENNSAYIMLSESSTGAHLACTEPYQKSDIHIGTEWKRYSLTFQAIADGTIYPRVEQSVTNNTIYVAGYKLELGKVATPWEPNEADAAEDIEHNESQFKVYSDKIDGVTKKQEQLGSQQRELETQVTQTAEGVKQNSKELDDANGKITKFQGQLESTAKGLKASYEEYTNKAIGQISDSSLNLIRNGSFSNRDNNFEQWQNVSEKANIREDENGLRWVELTQTGFSSDNPIGVTSNYFEVKQGKVTVAVDIKDGGKVALDNPSILFIELYDKNKNRVDFQWVNLTDLGLSSELLADHLVHRGMYRKAIDRADVKFMTLKGHIMRNGDICFTNFSAKLSSIDDGAYVPNPEDLNQQVLKQNTKIEQNAKEIALKASSTEVTKTVNDTMNKNNGGGVNLQIGTKDCSFEIGTNGNTSSIETYGSDTKMIHTQNGGFHTAFSKTSFVPTPGEFYTLSADVKGDGKISGSGFRYEGGNNGTMSEVTLSDNWQRIVNTVHVDRVQGQWVIYPSGMKNLYVKHLKIERGTIATPWTPAPEDTYTTLRQEIKSSKDAAIQVASDNVQIKVNELSTTLNDSFNQKINEAKEASQKFTSDGIEQTVTKITEVKNDVNNVNSKLDNLQVGTRNLLHHSDTFDGWIKGDSVTVTADKYLDGRITILGAAGVDGGQLTTFLDGPYNDDLVTWTVYAKADNAGDKLHTELWGGGGPTDQPLTTEWKKYKFSGHRDINHHDFYLWGCVGNKGNIYVALPFAVIGNTIGSWSPNPEDIDQKIDSVKTEATASIKNLGDRVTTEVNSVTTQMNNKISEINTKLDVANGKIEGKVTETQVDDILNGKGYATQSWAETMFTMKKDSITLQAVRDNITNGIQDQVNGINNKIDTQTLDSANIDQMKTQGHYFVKNLTGNPIGGWVYVDVTGNNNDRIRQDVYADQSYVHKFRSWNGSRWTDWEEEVKNTDIISKINISPENIRLSSNKIEIDGDTYIHGELNVPNVKLNGNNGSVDLSGDGIHIGGPDGDIKLDSGGIDITKSGQGLSITGDYIQVVTDSNGQKEITGLIGSNFNLKNKNQNGLALLVTPQQELGRPYGGDLLTIGELDKGGEVTSAVTFDATNITGDGSGFHWTAPHYLHGPAQAIHIENTQDNLTLLTLKMPHSSQEGYYQPALTVTHGVDGNGNYVHGDSGVEFLWSSIKPYGSVDMTDARLWVYGVDHGIKNVWVSWSGWDGGERYPALVNDIGYWGGIAFPKSGRVTLFDADGRYYTPDRNTGIGAYDNYMSKNNNWH